MFCCRKLHTQGNTTPCPELVAITRYHVCVDIYRRNTSCLDANYSPLIGSNSLTSCRLDGSPFCLHSLRQLAWWQESQLLGVVLEGEGEAVVELSLHLDRDTHCVEVKTWSVHVLIYSLCLSFTIPSLPSSTPPPLTSPLLPFSFPPSSQSYNPHPGAFALPHCQPRHSDCHSTTHRWHHPQI